MDGNARARMGQGTCRDEGGGRMREVPERKILTGGLEVEVPWLSYRFGR